MWTIKPTTCLLLAFTLLSLSSAAALGHDHKDVPSFVIDLDLPPKERYLELLPHYNDTVWGFYNDYFAKDFVLREALYGISAKRGPEPEEMMEEIQGLADASRLPVKFVKAIQMLYELQTLMVPVTNVSFPHLGDMIKGENARWFDDIPAEFEPLATRLPWRGPGCTGIIATNKEDGVVYHARNLDFSPLKVMTNLVYNGVFKKNGTELFQSQMIAGYTMVITGIKLGPNGYAIERNTRYTDHKGGNKEMLSHLFSGRPLNGWSLRKIMETETEYEKAVAAIASVPYVSTEYAIISGVKKGTILSKNPDNVAFRQVLGQANPQEPMEYIIMTNFDFFFHDIREFFDPTGHGGFGKPTRRVAAQKTLNATLAAGQPLTPDVLFSVINQQYVIADTVFQAVLSVEKAMWNISQPLLS
mmetsp:Transcript_1897/g.2329  ORF Transcript_1897/g.2329 Transcript_1897/m.2329 type:complete len:415 (+) Transcript_1897:43-1287(+)